MCPAAAPGAPWPWPQKEEPAEHLACPLKGRGINMPGANTKSPKAGYRITTSHVYFKEEAHLSEAPKSQHQGPGGTLGG